MIISNWHSRFALKAEAVCKLHIQNIMCYVVLCSQCQDWSFVHHKHKLTQNWFRLLSSQARDLKAQKTFVWTTISLCHNWLKLTETDL